MTRETGMSDRVPTLDTQDRGGFGPDPRHGRRPAGAGRVLAAVMLAPDQQDPAHPTGMTHLALNNLATALEAYGFELGGRPGDPDVTPYANAGDAVGAAVAARDLAVGQRENLRTALAELVDAVDIALSRPGNDPGEALGELDRPHREANRVLLDNPHRNVDANLDRLMIGRWPVKSCGAVAPHPPHVGGPIHAPWQCRGFGGFD